MVSLSMDYWFASHETFYNVDVQLCMNVRILQPCMHVRILHVNRFSLTIAGRIYIYLQCALESLDGYLLTGPLQV